MVAIAMATTAKHAGGIVEIHHDGDDQQGGLPLQSFPRKLYEMLHRSCQDDFEDVISWQPSGTGFVIHQVQKFADEIMPRFFTFKNKISTFHMMLRRYGFISSTNGYHHHKLFRRDRHDLIPQLGAKNNKASSTKKSLAGNHNDESTTKKAEGKEVEVVTSDDTSSVATGTVSSSTCCDTCCERDDDASELSDLEDEEGEEPEDPPTPTTTTSSLSDDQHMANPGCFSSSSRASNSLYQDLLCDFAMNLDGLAPLLPSQNRSSALLPAPAVPVTKRPATRPIKMRGPLRTPGRLRNGFDLKFPTTTSQAQCSIDGCSATTTKSDNGVVKRIVLDLASRNEYEKQESKRFQKPLCLHKISCDTIDHMQWGEPPTAVPSSSHGCSDVRAADESTTPFVPEPLSPALEELI